MDNTNPIIVTQNFNTSVEDVWSAITLPNRMRQWFFEQIESFKPEVGFTTRFNVETLNGNFLHLWKLTEVMPMKKITYNWKYGGYTGDSHVTFELSEDGNQTKLSVTHEGIESFPSHIPEFSRERCAGGWSFFIKDRLIEYLEGGM